MSINRKSLFLALSALLPVGAPLRAAEFEVLDRFTVDGYAVLRGSADISGGNFTVGGSAFVVKEGKVGIGTTEPAAELEVAGGIKVGNFTGCTADKAGTMRWSGQHFEGCTGTAWRQFDNQPPPTVSVVSPAYGLVSGGTAITIIGTGFNQGLELTLGGAPATSIALTGVTQITAVTPAGTAGLREVKITNPDGQNCGSAFTYNPFPTISSVNPVSGPQLTVITITGTGFASGAAVKVGNDAATGVTWDSATQLRATTPASSTTGDRDVTVTNPDTGSVVKSPGFTYKIYATGGDITAPSGYRVHTYATGTSDKTFTVATGGNVEVLVVAGGASGGTSTGGLGGGGGGGAGGLLYNASYAVSSGQVFTVTVGGGGASVSAASTRGNNGGNSVFNSLTAIGGGGGGTGNGSGDHGATGGSGGGAGYYGYSYLAGAAGTSGQGNKGGDTLSNNNGGGGGGAGGVGGNTNSGGPSGSGGLGGPGLSYSISGVSVTYAKGGEGGGPPSGFANGASNTGNGGSGVYAAGGSSGSGGSGIVIVRYPN